MPSGVYKRNEKSLSGLRRMHEHRRGKTYEELYGDNADIIRSKVAKASVGRKPNLGKKWTDEQKKNMGLAKRGERHGNWQGGKTKENIRQRNLIEYEQWRLAVFRRDNFTCQVTGQVGGELQAHHIVNFSDNKELRFDASNGITLTKRMHKKFHKMYGKKNNTIEQLLEFIGKEKS